MSWNYSEAIDRIGQGPLADRPALIHEQTTISFGELRRRSRGIAAWLQALPLKRHSHVGHYMRNSNAYLETFFGSGLIGCAHVNVNYRYQNRELEELCNTLDIEVLVYDVEFADRVAVIKPQLEKTIAFVEVTNTTAINDFAIALPELYDYPTENLQKNTAGDNQILIATGGTTGLPKGTQWLQQDLWQKMNVLSNFGMQPVEETPRTFDEYIGIIEGLNASPALFPMSPLMHGTGLMMAISLMAQGSPVVTTGKPKYDPDHCLDLIKANQVGMIVIVGDAFALPLLAAIENRDDNCFASIAAVMSSGAILSDESRARFKAQRETMILLDTLGSSEASGFAMTTEQAGIFMPMPTTIVLDENMARVEPGSDVIGMVYAGGYSPIGYYNEPEKSAETFVVVDNQRYVKTGDRCTLRSDGMLELLGRDSSVINTGGEKVFTIEVEQQLLRHESIADALVVGLPHPRFGKMVVAVVEGPQLSNSTIDVEAIQASLRQSLADYKVPRKIYAIESLQRFANGKVDYAFVTDYAADCFSKE